MEKDHGKAYEEARDAVAYCSLLCIWKPSQPPIRWPVTYIVHLKCSKIQLYIITLKISHPFQCCIIQQRVLLHCGYLQTILYIILKITKQAKQPAMQWPTPHKFFNMTKKFHTQCWSTIKISSSFYIICSSTSAAILFLLYIFSIQLL